MTLEISVIDVVTRMSFEDRDNFIRGHKYNPANTTDKSCFVNGNRKTISRTYTGYNLDDLYEYCVFRNYINILNRYCSAPKKRSFTMGHHIPLAQGGLHAPSNWIIQTFKDNTSQGDSLPENMEKMSWAAQVQYIADNIAGLKLDQSLVSEYMKYASKMHEVY